MAEYGSAAAIGVVCLVVGLVLWKRRKAPRTVGWFMLIAGFGVGGLLGRFLYKVGTALGKVVSTGTAQLFGVAVPAALLVGIGVWLFLDLHPRGQRPSRALPWLALMFPVLLATMGGMYAGIGGQLLSAVGDTAAELATVLVSGVR